MRIAVVGDGGWGTANAMLLAGYGHDVAVWGPFPDYIDEVRATRRNPRYLPGVELPAEIEWTSDRRQAVDGADIVVLAVPSKFFEDVCKSFAGLIPPDALVVSLTKGLGEKTAERMSEIARRTLGLESVTVLSGPTHAEEVARGVPTAIVAASGDIEAAKTVQRVWSGPRFRVYTSSDPVGVELGGAVKNVIAVAAGCSDGLGFGDNTRAALITRGIAEISRFVKAYGGKPETVAGLSGVGDLIVTCSSKHSRNHSVGERIGRGEKATDITASMQMVAEGVWNAHIVHDMAAKAGIEMPIADAVYRMCSEDMPAKDALELLMGRSPKCE